MKIWAVDWSTHWRLNLKWPQHNQHIEMKIIKSKIQNIISEEAKCLRAPWNSTKAEPDKICCPRVGAKTAHHRNSWVEISQTTGSFRNSKPVAAIRMTPWKPKVIIKKATLTITPRLNRGRIWKHQDLLTNTHKKVYRGYKPWLLRQHPWFSAKGTNSHKLWKNYKKW